MNGVVWGVNQRRGRGVVETTEGFVLFEILDSVELEVGMDVAGNLDALAGESLRVTSTGETFDVFIEAFDANKPQAQRFLG